MYYEHTQILTTLIDRKRINYIIKATEPVVATLINTPICFFYLQTYMFCFIKFLFYIIEIYVQNIFKNLEKEESTQNYIFL